MTKKKIYLYKFLYDGLVSAHGECEWKVGEWQKISGELKICHNGFHASELIQDALRYVNGPVLTKVEVRGDSVKEDTKQAWSEMRIIKAYHWTKIDSVKLAVYAAKKVLKIYESEYPRQLAPREAIKAAEAWLKKPTQENVNAAYAAAYAANAANVAANVAANASNAAYAAGAAYAAANAAYAAYAAYAANAANVAANVANATYAAYAAGAGKGLKKQFHEWCMEHLKNLKVYRGNK
jgi:hypothetical protein